MTTPVKPPELSEEDAADFVDVIASEIHHAMAGQDVSDELAVKAAQEVFQALLTIATVTRRI